MSGKELIPRSTIEEIVGHRNRAADLFGFAMIKIDEAADAIQAAESAVRDACGGTVATPYIERNVPEIEAFRNAVQRPDAAQYLRVSERLVDLQVWGSLVERTDLEKLMDKQAKDELRGQMSYVPEKTDRDGEVINADEIARGLPRVTVETVRSTLEGFALESDAIFRRGIANAFAELDRRFRSHDGFKIGSRVILSHAFDTGWGGWNYYQNHRDTLTDIERVFLVLDGKSPRATYGGIVGKIDTERRGSGVSVQQSEHEGDYFRVRIFKNGNAHLWFSRKDLLEKVNQLLAEHYGEVIGDGVDTPAAEPDPLEDRALTPARKFGFFPSPPAVVGAVLEMCPHSQEPLRVLEPSAGTGALARPLAEAGHRVTAVEIQPELARGLQVLGVYSRVKSGDFLRIGPNFDIGGLFDLVVMNPPFDHQRDIDHVSHAWKFLKPGGTLVAVMSAGTEWRENKKARAFRELMKANGATWRDLPMGSFREVGAEVTTVILKVKKR